MQLAAGRCRRGSSWHEARGRGSHVLLGAASRLECSKSGEKWRGPRRWRAAIRLEGPWKERWLFLGAKEELAEGLEQGSSDLLCVGTGPVWVLG